MGKRRRRDRQRGFTLLEIVVALGVLGFLMIGLTQGVRAGLAMWHAQMRRVEETAELDAAARVLRTLLTGIPTSSSGNAGNGDANGMAGGADHFAFIGDLPTGLGTTRRADITLELRRGRLVLLWTPHRHELSSEPAAPPTETELVGGVDRLEVAYWGSPSPGEPAAWLSQWEGPGSPELIRVRLIFAKGDLRRWPDLIAASQL